MQETLSEVIPAAVVRVLRAFPALVGVNMFTLPHQEGQAGMMELLASWIATKTSIKGQLNRAVSGRGKTPFHALLEELPGVTLQAWLDSEPVWDLGDVRNTAAEMLRENALPSEELAAGRTDTEDALDYATKLRERTRQREKDEREIRRRLQEEGQEDPGGKKPLRKGTRVHAAEPILDSGTAALEHLLEGESQEEVRKQLAGLYGVASPQQRQAIDTMLALLEEGHPIQGVKAEAARQLGLPDAQVRQQVSRMKMKAERPKRKSKKL